jgi:hypothetical protein
MDYSSITLDLYNRVRGRIEIRKNMNRDNYGELSVFTDLQKNDIENVLILF